ncbi:MAG: iron ABC transporter permease [Thermoanaerobacteraceae bacterium]|nr:iron ABC transporter permease [Thermoanaerobacteraceae bacterium]
MFKTSRLKATYLNTWALLSLIFVLLILAPNVNILINALKPGNENWYHIKEYLLKDYIINSLTLVAFTGLFTVLLGTTLAWLVSVFEFPFRKFFKWGLILPLAIPPYIAAYTYDGLLNYTGVIQTFLRNSLKISVNQKYFNIMSMEGAVFIFTAFLYPYVYIITKSFLEKQSASLIENSRMLGRSPLEIFFYVILPLSRTAILGGVSLVILEVLNDYGVVKYFGIVTFSTAIFKTWFALGDIDSAVKLAAILMFMVFAVLLMENLLRGRKKFSYTTSKVRPITPLKLQGMKAAGAFVYCFTVFSLSFLIPTLQLVYWAFLAYQKVLHVKFWVLIINSLSAALVSSVLVIAIAVVIANYCRLNDGLISKIYSKITTLGYSIPGSVIAMGVIVFFVGLDRRLVWLYHMISENSSKLVLSTSMAMLTFAYIIRFLAIGYNAIEAGFARIGRKFLEASRTLGMNVTQTFFKVELKMLQPAIISGLVLVFIDILKELPLTLILRPFNFDTLATKSFEYAGDEMIHEAAISSLIIIIISAVSVYFFYKIGDREES